MLMAFLLVGCEGMLEDPQGERQASGQQSTSGQKAKHEGKPAPAGQGRPVVRAMFRRLRVREDSRVRYSREAFEHWIDEDSNGCDTRREVLRRSNRAHGDRGWCGAERGLWVSAYDGEVSEDPRDFEIDHLIPLAEAWRSGADEWPDAKRRAFANDLHPYSLIAVSSASNQSKADKDPSKWLPPNRGFQCQYVARWIAVKFRWRLAVDPAEHRALSSLLETCDPASLRLNLKVAAAR